MIKILNIESAYRNRLVKIAENYGVLNSIKFLGRIKKEKLRPFYKNALVYVQPSFYETFGKTVIEAMSCGCPVVGANTSSTPEIIGDSGLLFDPYNSDDLAKTLENVIFDERLRIQLINKGYNIFKMFSLKDEASNLVKIFKDL